MASLRVFTLVDIGLALRDELGRRLPESAPNGHENSRPISPFRALLNCCAFGERGLTECSPIAFRAVEQLAQQVQVADVPRGLLEHVLEDPAQARLPEVAIRGDVVQGRRGDDL